MMKDIVIVFIILVSVIVLIYIVVVKGKGNVYVEINGELLCIVIKKKSS